jgi:hypothetical protein
MSSYSHLGHSVMLIVVVALQQRMRAPLSGPETALPEFPDDDSWYYNVHTNAILPRLFINPVVFHSRYSSFHIRGPSASLNSLADPRMIRRTISGVSLCFRNPHAPARLICSNGSHFSHILLLYWLFPKGGSWYYYQPFLERESC